MSVTGRAGARARHPGPLRLLACSAGIMLCAIPVAHAAVTISSAGTSNMSCTSGVCTPTAATAVLNVDDLETLLANGNVKLAAAGEPVYVDVEAALSWASTSVLTRDSYHSINVEQPGPSTAAAAFRSSPIMAALAASLRFCRAPMSRS